MKEQILKIAEQLKYDEITTDYAQTLLLDLFGVSGCFIVSNEKTPDVCEHYKVIYTDGTEGMEFFNGNMWLVKYEHPVKMWWLVLNNR